MDPTSLLDQLAPLREPDPVGWWPLAPGWWLVIMLACVGLLLLARWLWQRRQHNRYRRLALKQLGAIAGDGAATLEQVNTLLKATALRGWPRERVAALHGEAWLSLLRDSCPALDPQCLGPLANAYRNPGDDAPAALVEGAALWIRQHSASSPEVAGD